ncbi:NAD-dependent protein deacylase-like isoform X1 [Diabrotica virgifera virgifera]|uniref:NAD-dependent protein deacylase n=2 Tax=Diabrotica virgifera virgifera TaxID=50390 RepID=A0A6P7H8M0_DIAVI|nr:NAD-dependent protein deacylase-like isoform X1 [Diabrotica virgifera virgifera]
MKYIVTCDSDRQIAPRLYKMGKRKLSDYAGFSKCLNEAKNVAVLTGAGVSAESGIPVFRGAGGFWRTHRSQDLATPQAFAANPALVWEFYHYRRNIAFNSIPNNAHKALALFEKKCSEEGKEFHIITQNVDGLHQKAGSKNVIELHGALHKVKCTNPKCRFIDENYDNPICEVFRDRGDPAADDYNLPIIDKKDLPKCKKCQKLVRPYIVWFGENLDLKIMQTAKSVIEACDICLVIGTSSVVYPAAMFAPRVLERGMPVAEFNLNEEPADEMFTFHFPGKCGSTLPKALEIDLE